MRLLLGLAPLLCCAGLGISRNVGIVSCVDSHRYCRFWSNTRQCERLPYEMFNKCRKSCNACQDSVGEETKTRVISHTQGYTTSSGACATASLGASVTVNISIEITATSQTDIQNFGHLITEH